ncbi:hypothetical protein H7X46_14290 [Pseudonocardia sp. C8]|uniref:hypothetical protein n=1 Tax=Pseudonocardia sp. C8 TaxID=2762759 RepID=UPI0016426EF6|nr:hypothetical protein [Pseudonocardia sp. C8]MBC3192231.1 hypothetical protein [Pseudonocardia sp. C8]
MSRPSDLEARLAALEARVEAVAADATAARHLAAARDRDLAEVGRKLDATRSGVTGLGEQSAARFAHLEERFARLERRLYHIEDGMGTGFAELRGRLDQAAAGQQQIVELLHEVLAQERDR